MKRYLVGVLALALLVSISMLYKQSRQNALHGFYKADPSDIGGPVLHLYGFFSSDSCMPCGEVIGVLNQLPEDFRVTGVVPQGEASRIGQLKEQYRIRFPVHSAAKYRRYGPVIYASIIGASARGKILFILPCATLRPDEIVSFLVDFHMKLAPYLADASF